MSEKKERIRKYANIKIKKELYDEIEAFIAKEGWLGYNSVTSFCVEAMRKMFLQLRELAKKKKDTDFQSIDREPK